MGNEGSSEPKVGEDNAEEEKKDTRPTPGQLHNKFLAAGFDAKTAFEDAYEDDKEAQRGIRRYVDLIEGRTPEADDEEGDEGQPTEEQKAEIERKARAARKREERAEAAATRRADNEADAWFRQELTRGEKELEAARIAKESERAANELQAARDAAYKPFREVTVVDREALQQVKPSAEKCLLMEAPLQATSQPNEPGGGKNAPEPPPPQEEDPNAKPVPEYYKLLGVPVDATIEEIRKGYRKQALRWHPDKNRDRLEKATERFKKISEAFDTLFDPQKREMYDAGEVKEKKAKKLTGHGWADLADEDDDVLTKAGWKYKRGSWNAYVFFRGRIDDEDPIIDDPVNDPRVPQEKIKIFWRYIGELAYNRREDPETGRNWMGDFIAEVWKDTPSRWPGSMELKGMNDAAQQEWKERRMVFNRRRQKAMIAIELHEDYLDIPDRLEKEEKRLSQYGVFKKEFGPLPEY